MQHSVVNRLVLPSYFPYLRLAYFTLAVVVPHFVGSYAADRVALVIGNARYEDAVGPLRNAVNDSKAMAHLLKSLGFHVLERHNVDRDDLIKSMSSFRDAIKSAQVSLFYFAGHGLSIGGNNYLVPIKSGFSSTSTDPTTQRLLAETRLFNVEQAVADMKSAGGHCHLIILDACRSSTLTSTGRNRDLITKGGLSEMTPPAGSLVAFATDSGHTAFDGEGKHGLYTEELMRHLQTPGLTIEQVFKRTRASVLERSQGGQMPAEYSRLIGEDIFLAGVAASPAPSPDQEPLAPNPSDLLRLARDGLANECATILRAQAAQIGPHPSAVDPLSILLEGVKEDLKTAVAPSPKVIAAAESCSLVLELLPLVVPPDHEQLRELTAKAYNRRGDALLLLGQPAKALQDFDDALSFIEDDAYIYYNRGCALLALNRHDEARSDFLRAAQPTQPQPGAKRLAEQALKSLSLSASAAPSPND
jgi:tetratricopeptide (TPR) repeat protein